MENHTTVTLPNETKESLDEAAKALFETDDVAYRATIERLIDECREIR